MRDVEYLAVKGRFNFKALTDKARAVMGGEIGGPWQMAADVFFYGVTPDKFDQTIKRLRAKGLQTEPDKVDTVDIRSLTEF